MTVTTQRVRDQGVMVVECDIPAELTIAQYRARREESARRQPSGPRRRPFLKHRFAR